MKKSIAMLIIFSLLLASIFNIVFINNIKAIGQHENSSGVVTTGAGIHSITQKNETSIDAFKQNLTTDWNDVTFSAYNLSCLSDDSPSTVFASLVDGSVESVFENVTWKSWMPDRPVNTLEHILPDVLYLVEVSKNCILTVPFDNFSVYRTIGSNSEKNNFSFSTLYSHVDNVTLKIPLSTNVEGIINVTNNTGGVGASEVNISSELVNNTFWYDATNQYVYIRTINLSLSTVVNWTINCSYGVDFNLIIPPYLEVGQYFHSEGLITDSNGYAISGMIAETRLLYPDGTDALSVNPKHNCTGGNYYCTFSTATLIPGVYSVSIEFTDPTSGIRFKEGSTLYLSVNPSSGIHVYSKLYFTFYNNNSGIGLDSNSFKIYASTDTTISSTDRIYRDTYDTYTGDTIYYRIDDYFDNQIYPLTGDYQILNITSINQFEDIPICWYSFSVKNMNHSIVRFLMTNGSRTYTQYLFPYEPFYWNILPGEYTVNLTYYDTETDAVVSYLEENISITTDTYYWIRGYDLRDIIIEIQATNISLNDLIIRVTMNVNISNSSIDNIVLDILTNLSLTENNITALINNVQSVVDIIDSLVIYLNNTIWLNLTTINAMVDTINNKLTIDFGLLNVTVDYINNTIWTEINTVNTTVNTMNNNIISQVLISEANITTLNNNLWNSINLTDLIVDYLNATLWSNFTAISNQIGSLNFSYGGSITLAENNITTLQLNLWTDINATLKNRSLIMLNFYNTNDGLGLPEEVFKAYVNGDRLTGKTFWCLNNTEINITIKDYYNFTLYNNTFDITAPYTFLDLGLTFHSWLFGNKNDDYYMISFLKSGASRWYERGIVPYSEREFILPSGNYTMRIYDKDYNELLNNSYTVDRSMVYVIHGTNLSVVISGLSVIVGQLLEIQSEFYYATMSDIITIISNPPTVFSLFERKGQIIGDTFQICPKLVIKATTINRTIASYTISRPLIPVNDTTNGSILIDTDELYLSGPGNISVNITYTDNGTVLSHTSFVPNKFTLFGENLTINASANIIITRETTYQQSKKFYWTWRPYEDSNTATINVSNRLNTILRDIYVYAEFNNRSEPKDDTITVNDIANNVILKYGEDFLADRTGIHFKIAGSIAENTYRLFTLSYTGKNATASYEGDATTIANSFSVVNWMGDGYNYFQAGYVNSKSMTYKGPLNIILNFSEAEDILLSSVRIYDTDRTRELTRLSFLVTGDHITIQPDAMGEVPPGGGRTFNVYFLLKSEVDTGPTEFGLNDIIGVIKIGDLALAFTWTSIICIVLFILALLSFIRNTKFSSGLGICCIVIMVFTIVISYS